MLPFSAGRLLPLALASCLLLAVFAAGWVFLERRSQPPGFERQPPAVGEPAPSFTLRDANGAECCLGGKRARPMVVEFGSATCVECVLGQFERREALAREYADRAEFVFVYCREANPGHAVGAMAVNSGPAPEQTFTWAERAARARTFRKSMGVARRILIDGDGDDSAQSAYGGRDNHCVVISPDGRIVFKQEQADHRELRRFLQRYLQPEGRTIRRGGGRRQSSRRRKAQKTQASRE